MEYILLNSELKIEFTDFGGTIKSIKDQDKIEYMWQGNPTYWGGTAPILFPICGSIRNDKATIGDGLEINMPRHGIVRKKIFKMQKMNNESIEFSISSDKDSMKQFPYEFNLVNRYQLEGRTVKVTYIVENTGNKDMPFFIGGHPGFNCPIIDDETFNDYYLQFECSEDCTVPYPITETGLIDMNQRTLCMDNTDILKLRHELFHRDAIIMDELKSRKVKLCSTKSETGIEIDFKDFPYLIIWSSANNGPFVALEPWTGLSTCSDESDVFEQKRNVQSVKPGEKREYSFTISIL